MIDLSMFSARPVAVLGLARSGLAAARALAAGGAEVWAWDDDPKVRAAAEAAGVRPLDPAQWNLGQAAALMVSPGIPHRHPSPHPVVARARSAGTEVIGDVELLVHARPDATYVGVTGTNGKSTTTALIGHILAAAGRRCQVGGNIGVPALALEPLEAGGIYVLEISSYQLETTPSLVCDVAVLLNISPDHLDRHGGMAGYVAAKRRIFRGQSRQEVAVVGVDDGDARHIAATLAGGDGPRLIPVSGRAALEHGVFAADGVLYDACEGGPPRAVLELAGLPALPGAHNAQNAAAAYAVARTTGVPTTVAAQAIATFPGLAHRQELVAVVDGIAYVNDSKATNPEAAARALACYDAVYWIAGGLPKDSDLAPVAPYLERVRHAYLIGAAAKPFAAELSGKVPLSVAGTLQTALAEAKARAERNGARHPVVLLSPACASFDQFTSFEARGEAFRAMVEALQQ